ncbi:hypothetical protein FOZ63_026379, partial [Perkinsus olseni]
EDSVVTVGIAGPFGLRTAMVLQWTYGRYIVHPIFDAMIRSMRVGERAIFTPLPGADSAYVSDERLSVSCDPGPQALASGVTMEEAILKWVLGAPDVTPVPSLTAFDCRVCEMVLVTVNRDEQGDTSVEAVLSRSRMRKDIGNRLLAVGALQEARSEYMSALDGLKMLHKAPHEKPSKEQEALELAVNLNLSLVCLKQGDHPEAQRFAMRAKELDPDNMKARYRLALALIEQRKEEDRAVHILETVSCPVDCYYGMYCNQYLIVLGLLILGCDSRIHSGRRALHSIPLQASSIHGLRRSSACGLTSLLQLHRQAQLESIMTEIPLYNLHDTQYVGPIGVGTSSNDDRNSPQQTVNVVFDTGSTNIWVQSDLCESPACVSLHKYSEAESRTFVEPHRRNRYLDILFGTGELKGLMASDTISVGPYKVSNQSFAMIQEEIGKIFQQIPFEGILGLAFPKMAANGQLPFFDNVMRHYALGGRNEFSFYFQPSPGKGSMILFGGVDTRLYDGPIRMFPVVQEYYWAIQLVDFKIGEESFASMPAGTRRLRQWVPPRVSKLIFDTGTTYFAAPSFLFTRISRRLPPAPCATVAMESRKYPDIHYLLKDENAVIFDLAVPAKEYMLDAGEGQCVLAFMPMDVPGRYGPALILGEVFMRRWLTTYDRGDGSPGGAYVGLARAKHIPS